MLWANSWASLSLEVELAVGGAAAAGVTVMRAVASFMPLSFLATSRYVVDSLGVTFIEPLGSTFPIPSMLTSLAKSVFQVSVEAWPATIAFGLAVSIAVGAGAAGGGTGAGAGGFFLEQAVTVKMIAKAEMRLSHFIRCSFNFVSPIARALASVTAEGGRCSSRSYGGPTLSYLKLQFGCVFSPLLVNWRTWLPSASMLQICVRPLRFD